MTVNELHCDYKNSFNRINSIASYPDTSINLNTVIDSSNSDAVSTVSTEAQDPQNGPTQIINDYEYDSTPAHIVVEQLVPRTTSALTKNSEIQNKYPPASPSEIQKESPPTLLYKIQQEHYSPDVEIINSNNTLLLDTGYEFLDKWDFTSFFMLPQNENDGTDLIRKILIYSMLKTIKMILYFVLNA
ncbi:hypothetical protein CIHG_10054 [Coccidioides immitis H538.4]|uniref:Uncharacterized protein n=1 Tax=Coccidioides immitis H538.4 TaxID=396776 RepID=A0A0J8S524_COCIT|nr:hypothetical protein CIHG_10054 [Coccidioides immitis H538.4]